MKLLPKVRPISFASSGRSLMWAVIAALLILPLVAMQFTAEVAWTASDFAAAAVLLGGAGLVCELAARAIPDPLHRLLVKALLVSAVALIWAEGAVGVFGN